MRRCGLGVLAVLGLACASGDPSPRGPSVSPTASQTEPRTDPTAALVPTGEIAGHFLMRQQLAFEAGDERGGFEALVQKHCDELVVVGLTPFGSRAFTLRQRGVEVEVETHIDVAWPFAPRRILLDVHRAYFLPLPDPPAADGTRELQWKGEIVSERWESGRLWERRFRRADGVPPEEIIISYRDGAAALDPPTQLRLDNRRFGYRLDVTTVERRVLSCP